MRRSFLFLSFLLTALLSTGQLKPDSSRAGISALCDKFMQTFQSGRFSEAVQLLKVNSTLGAGFVDNLDKSMSSQMGSVQYNYKKMVGFDLIEEKEIKNILIRRRYLLKFEMYFLSFDFYLYNNGTGWTISGFYYNDDQKILF
ncbi:MAG: hypothetical protein IPI66_04230 [Chitinophagaceae bacterium]|nr:hypothetical protein [Chitinophagaceae bacterium]MBL0055564.1 hypothetical protein [Chitinophagaceae bacterium]